MINTEQLNLSKNPFSTTPSGEKRIWAGMPDVKDKIESLYNEIFTSDIKKIVLNWGPMGGGKTHAAEYYSRERDFGGENIHVTHIFCNIPFEAKDSGKNFLRRVIDSLTIQQIKQEISHATKILGKEALIKHLVSKTRSDIFPDTVLRLFEIPADEVIRRYIHEGLPAVDMKKVHLAKSLKSDEDFFNFTIALLSCISATKDRRIVMWIDEMENMLYYQNKQYRTFGMMIRELSDKVAERLLVFLNFTLTEDDVDTIKLLIGEALWARINTNIRFNELSENDASKYLHDLIAAFLIDKSKNSPFSGEVIKKIIQSIPAIKLIPREINKQADRVLRYALINEIKQISEDTVSRALSAD